MKKVIFACVHSAGRSQMAAAFFNHLTDVTKFKAVSAGTQPSDRVHPEVVIIMQEIGIDLSEIKPQLLTEELAASANLLVTMGCEENCPYVPDLEIIDWDLQDPKGKDLETVRKIRDQIKNLVSDLVKSKKYQ